MLDNLKDDFVDGWIAEGLTKGLAQGLAKGLEHGLEQGRAKGIEQGIEQGIAQGEAQMLLRAMTAHGLTVTEDIRLRVTACADLAQVELWFDRAMTATTIDEVFEGPGRRWPDESESDESDGKAEDAGGVVAQQGLGGEA
jgi:hypothetical protein